MEVECKVIWPITAVMWVGEDCDTGQMNGAGILDITGRGGHPLRIE